MNKARWLIIVSIVSALAGVFPILTQATNNPGLRIPGVWPLELVEGQNRSIRAERQLDQVPAQDVEPIPNLYLAFGDSITCYPNCWPRTFATVDGIDQDDAYPETLDVRLADSVVVDAGKPEEGTYGGSERITSMVSTHRPKYVLIMKGTNDVSRDKLPSDVKMHLKNMIDNAREAAGVAGVEVMLATLIPRADGMNDETEEMNALAIVPAAQSKGVPVCDQWGAWMALPYWANLLQPDGKHPNTAGRALIADTFSVFSRATGAAGRSRHAAGRAGQQRRPLTADYLHAGGRRRGLDPRLVRTDRPGERATDPDLPGLGHGGDPP